MELSDTIERIIGKAIIDETFRDTLLDDPDKAIKDYGIQISDAEMNDLKQVIDTMDIPEVKRTFREYAAVIRGGWQS